MIALLLINGTITLGLALVMYKQLRYANRQQQQLRLCETALADIHVQHKGMLKADIQFSQQLQALDKQLLSLSVQLQQLENKRDNDGGYHHALRILEMGGTRDEIIEGCHLSNAQADLLMNLHAYRTAIAPGKQKQECKSES